VRPDRGRPHAGRIHLAEYANHLLFPWFGNIENVSFRIMTESMNHRYLLLLRNLRHLLKNYAGTLASSREQNIEL
jgi:hypothetical protein